MTILSSSVLTVALLLTNLSADNRNEQQDKLKASTDVITEFSRMKENIPTRLFGMTEGVVIIPKMINAGFGVAGKRGKGIALVKRADGSWSDPVFVSLTGGSVGLQAGVQSVDLVLMVKSRQTLINIKRNSFNLGGDVSVTAGPLGRNSTVNTDAAFDAEIYSYSKTKGLFAGISLSGSVLDIDEKANRNFYEELVDRADPFEVSPGRSASRTSRSGMPNHGVPAEAVDSPGRHSVGEWSSEVNSLKQTLTDLFK